MKLNWSVHWHLFPYIYWELEDIPHPFFVWNAYYIYRPSQPRCAGPWCGRWTARWARPCRSPWSGSALCPAGGPADPIRSFQSPVVLLSVWGDNRKKQSIMTYCKNNYNLRVYMRYLRSIQYYCLTRREYFFNVLAIELHTLIGPIFCSSIKSVPCSCWSQNTVSLTRPHFIISWRLVSLLIDATAADLTSPKQLRP